MNKQPIIKIVKKDVKKPFIVEETSTLTFNNANTNNKENELQEKINLDMFEAIQELDDMEKGIGDYQSFTSIESLLEDLHK